jgi:2-polyprenyl-6-methoxyphenol hydroxylase-like FAD-dependent oxidoreductase
MKVTNSNVLIAGAGPVGLAMAADLARYGVSVRLVEKSPERTDKSKALVLWSRTLELMDRMDCTAPFPDDGQESYSGQRHGWQRAHCKGHGGWSKDSASLCPDDAAMRHRGTAGRFCDFAWSEDRTEY